MHENLILLGAGATAAVSRDVPTLRLGNERTIVTNKEDNHDTD